MKKSSPQEKPAVQSPFEDGKCLSREDLFAVEQSQAHLERARSLLQIKRMEDAFDDLNTRNQHLLLQVKAHELTIERMKKQAAFDSQTKALEAEHRAKGDAHNALKADLAIRYQIVDWGAVAYDDLTGIISLLPTVPTQET